MLYVFDFLIYYTYFFELIVLSFKKVGNPWSKEWKPHFFSAKNL
uniref:Uncharacterized protein n=1 Tax=Lepeophtheirus salmonis TaxID=72036 RepID=A0A0K2UBW6_LEPSM